MKRIIAIALFTLMAITCFASCGAKEFTCDMCQQTVKSKEYKIEYEGEKATVCKDCKEMWDGLKELAEGLGELEGLIG